MITDLRSFFFFFFFSLLMAKLTYLKGKQLALPYAKAVMKMLPKTFWEEGAENVPHEPINEIHVHNLTMQQLFQPVSESRHFTREDAAKAFHDNMLSADKRSPQPELIEMERAIIKGSPRPSALTKFREVTPHWSTANPQGFE